MGMAGERGHLFFFIKKNLVSLEICSTFHNWSEL